MLIYNYKGLGHKRDVNVLMLRQGFQPSVTNR
jgi:hypothetical protein